MVEGARLESVYTCKGIEGSNPSLSHLIYHKLLKALRHYVWGFLVEIAKVIQIQLDFQGNEVYRYKVFRQKCKICMQNVYSAYTLVAKSETKN